MWFTDIDSVKVFRASTTKLRTWSIWRSMLSIGSASVDDRPVDKPDGAAGD
jgi:hypothetical protein